MGKERPREMRTPVQHPFSSADQNWPFLAFLKAVCVDDPTTCPQESQKDPRTQSYSRCRSKSLHTACRRRLLGSLFWNEPTFLYPIHTIKLRIKLLHLRIGFFKPTVDFPLRRNPLSHKARAKDLCAWISMGHFGTNSPFPGMGFPLM